MLTSQLCLQCCGICAIEMPSLCSDNPDMHWLAYITMMVADVLAPVGSRPSATIMLTWLWLEHPMNHIDGLVQKRGISNALAMELCLSSTNPPISCKILVYQVTANNEMMFRKVVGWANHRFLGCLQGCLLTPSSSPNYEPGHLQHSCWLHCNWEHYKNHIMQYV